MSVLAAVALLSACTVGPDYQRPSAPVPAQYKEAGWKIGEPLDAIERGAWWSVYKDAVLDGLEKQVDISNQNLKAAEAAFQRAEWIVAQARAGYFPSATVYASAQRSRGGGAAGGGTAPVGGGGGGGTHNQTSSAPRPLRAGPRICGDKFAAPSRAMLRARTRAPVILPAPVWRLKARSPAIICNCGSLTS